MPEATMDVGDGRERAVPAHPALTAFVHPCTAGAEASRLHQSIPQVFLRGKGQLSMSYTEHLIFPSPEPPSHGPIQRFLNPHRELEQLLRE